MTKFAEEKQSAKAIVEAMNSGNEQELQMAWEAFHQSVVEKVRADFEELQESHDAAVLAERGYRQLTSKETKWYQKLIEAGKSSNPKQAFATIIGSDADADLMPTTIIEDVYKHLKEDHPLLGAINFQYVKYATKWILNDHATQQAVWGSITDEIVREITSSFRPVDINQSKLSAYAILEKGMLDLGPTFLDAYIRAVLGEAIYRALELAIVAGTGVNQPVGLIKDIHKGVSYSSETGYPNKTAVQLKSFSPVDYGAVLATLATTEDGKARKFNRVGLICNMTDYLTKVMPATTVLNANGTYSNNLFPFATDVYVVNGVETGKAVVFLPEEYFLGIGGDKNATIEYSDEAKFIEDQRAYKIKQYAAGRAFDNTSAVYLDINALAPAYITVLNKEPVA